MRPILFTVVLATTGCSIFLDAGDDLGGGTDRDGGTGDADQEGGPETPTNLLPCYGQPFDDVRDVDFSADLSDVDLASPSYVDGELYLVQFEGSVMVATELSGPTDFDGPVLVDGLEEATGPGYYVRVAPDGLTMLFAVDGVNGIFFWRVTRASSDPGWAAVAEADEFVLSGAATAAPPFMGAPTDEDVYSMNSGLVALGGSSQQVELVPLNLAEAFEPWVSRDGLVIVYASYDESAGGKQLYQSSRADPADVWSTPEKLPGAVNNNSVSEPWLSSDLCRMYYTDFSFTPPRIRFAQRIPAP